MHYTEKMKNEIEHLKSEKDNADELLREIIRYLNSSKFRCGDELDGYVNVSDMLSRIGLAQDALYTINQK